MHTMWKGSIAFGLVNIPIKLFAATEDKDIKLRMLHKDCKTPVKNARICPKCQKELQNSDIVKGFEYVKGKFVILPDEELQSLKETHEERNIEILDFVKLEEIDPIYFDRSYYIGPGDNSNKAYSLLREALKQSGKIGLANITMRSKQNLVVIRVYENCLLMETIHYPDEIRNVKEVPAPKMNDVNEKELQTAIMLIDQLTTNFDPSKYEDNYRAALAQLIQNKIKNNEGTEIQDLPQTNVVDLMSALQASLESKKPSKKSAAPKAKKTKKL